VGNRVLVIDPNEPIKLVAPRALDDDKTFPGFPKFGWLNILKNSARNCAVSRSLNLKTLVTEKSTFLNPESRNVLRPKLPKVPKAGGMRIEPFTA